MIHRIAQFLAWMALVAVVLVTVSPISLRPHDFASVQIDRAGAFAFLAALFVVAYPKRWPYAGLAIIAASGGIEFLQELSPSRHAQLADGLVKASGASVGVLLGWVVNKASVWHQAASEARDHA